MSSGPYRLVRHPIYTRVLPAPVGTAVALGRTWLIATALARIYLGYAAAEEERFLAQQFPDTYPAYRRSPKVLLPFID